jgi:uracil-DNA glycosylase family 4
MTDKEVRDELASVARSASRLLGRERAAGTGELLAQSAARAAEQTARPTGLSHGEPGAGAEGTSGRRFTSMRPDVPSAPVPGPPIELPDFLHPDHHDPLAPAGLDARSTLLAASHPVLETIAGEVRACRMCGLCETRTNAVPGIGSAQSGIVFVGEAPGADEDRRGEPFVGRAGELLTKIIQAMDDARLIPGVPLTRQSVYICNVLKCRPPENRNPLPHEIEKCSPYLHRQLEALDPRIICCLGKFAAELLVGVKGTIASMRGSTYRFRGAKLIVTYHPAACLRNPNYKRPVWEDMQRLAHEYQTD